MADYYENSDWLNNFTQDNNWTDTSNSTNNSYDIWDSKDFTDDFDKSLYLNGTNKDDSNFWGSVSDYFDSNQGQSTLWSGLGGLASTAYDAYKTSKQEETSQERYDQERADRLAYQEKQIALQEAALALQQAIFNDKVATRKAHNDSVNAGSSGSGVKKATFG